MGSSSPRPGAGTTAARVAAHGGCSGRSLPLCRSPWRLLHRHAPPPCAGFRTCPSVTRAHSGVSCAPAVPRRGSRLWRPPAARAPRPPPRSFCSASVPGPSTPRWPWLARPLLRVPVPWAGNHVALRGRHHPAAHSPSGHCLPVGPSEPCSAGSAQGLPRLSLLPRLHAGTLRRPLWALWPGRPHAPLSPGARSAHPLSPRVSCTYAPSASVALAHRGPHR